MEILKLKNAKGRITGYRARLGQLQADGETPADAKQKLSVEIERALTADYAPVTISHMGRTRVIVRHPSGTLQTVRIDTDGRVWDGEFGFGDIAVEVKSCRLDLAQQAWPDALAADVLKTDEERREFASWVRFQEAYRDARAKGLSDVEAHALACAA